MITNNPVIPSSRRLTPTTGQRRYFLQVLVGVFVAIAVLSIVAVELAQRAAREQITVGITNANRQAVNAMARDARETLVDVTADLLAFRSILARRLADGQAYDELQRVFLDFMDSHRVYDQLRFIDGAGLERVRVDNETRGPVGLRTDQLQDKALTGYFRKALQLRPDQVLITQIEPNRENGQIEVPVKPVIRSITPVIVNGEPAGYAVLNYRARILLENLESIGGAALGKPLIVSGLGFEAHKILQVDTPQALTQLAGGDDFPARMPGAWRRIEGQPEGVVDDGSGGIIVFRRLFPGLLETPAELGGSVSWTLPMNTDAGVEGGLYMMMHMDADLLNSITGLALGSYRTVVAVFLAIALALAWFVALRLASVRDNATRLHEMATRDSLTGLLNRGEFLRRAEQAMAQAERHGRAMGVLYIDLDRFKEVNDTLGHAVGDELLLFVSVRLAEAVRKSDVVGRMGGDEFALVLTDIRGRTEAQSVAEKLSAELNTQVLLGGQDRTVRSSVGSAAYPEDGETIEALLDQADKSMYRQKSDDRNADNADQVAALC